MKIQIGGLSEGVHHYQFDVPAGEIGLTSDFEGNIQVDIDLEKVGDQLGLEGKVKVEGRFVCDRCAGEFNVPVAATYRMYYAPEGAAFEGIDPAELQVIPQGVGSIDIADDVRQTVVLAIPLKLLCNEGCKGLCPHCGKNLNEGNCSCTLGRADARWDVLKPLKDSN
jgi:uncharacterized protein